jgi:hypothetical protein
MIQLAGHSIASDSIAAVGPVRRCFKAGYGNQATFQVCLKGGQSLQLEYADEDLARKEQALATRHVKP